MDKEQQIRHGARRRYNGQGDMPVILMGILAKVGVHRIRFHLTHDILDLRDRFAMTLELRILIASKKDIPGTDDLRRFQLLGRSNLRIPPAEPSVMIIMKTSSPRCACLIKVPAQPYSRSSGWAPMASIFTSSYLPCQVPVHRRA